MGKVFCFFFKKEMPASLLLWVSVSEGWYKGFKSAFENRLIELIQFDYRIVNLKICVLLKSILLQHWGTSRYRCNGSRRGVA